MSGNDLRHEIQEAVEYALTENNAHLLEKFERLEGQLSQPRIRSCLDTKDELPGNSRIASRQEKFVVEAPA